MLGVVSATTSSKDSRIPSQSTVCRKIYPSYRTLLHDKVDPGYTLGEDKIVMARMRAIVNDIILFFVNIIIILM